INLLSGGAARNPDAHALRPLAGDTRENVGFQRVKTSGLAEKVSDVDQEVLVKRMYFLRIVLEPLYICIQRFGLDQKRAAQNAALDRIRLILAEIHARGSVDAVQDLR